jgi:hypothetical protein
VSRAPKLTEVVAEGNACSVECAIRPSGEAPAKLYLEGDLETIREGGKNKPQTTARARFMVLFQTMADYGRVQGKRFSVEMEGLYAFKHEVRKVQIRFPCFQDGNKWILTHGFIKPGAKKGLGDWPQEQINRAKEIREEYFTRKKNIEDAKRGEA